jgi:hypothetical protein
MGVDWGLAVFLPPAVRMVAVSRPKKSKVFLLPVERARLSKIVRTGVYPAFQRRRAQVLLGLDENQPDVPKRRDVAVAAGVAEGTVFNIARDFEAAGGDIDEVLTMKHRATPPVEPRLTGDVEAKIIAMACSDPPEGEKRWSLRLLEKHVELDPGLPNLDHSTIGRALKRGRFTLT